MKKILITALIVGVAYYFHTSQDNNSVAKSETSTLTSQKIVRAPAAVVDKCGTDGTYYGDIVAVKSEVVIRKIAADKGEKLLNEKATAALGEKHYHSIDQTSSIRRHCEVGDWTEIQITAPEWLTDVQGWVPTKNLRVIERSADGERLFIENDFAWDKDTKKFKSQLTNIVNKISREHVGCKDIDTGTLMKSVTDTKKSSDPVFFITCSGKPSFNVLFRPTDTKRVFTAVTPVSKGAAILACEKAAKSKTTHPSTVNFSKFMDASFKTRPDGDATLVSTFTAKNGFNLEVKFKIRCLFEGNKLVESQAVESN